MKKSKRMLIVDDEERIQKIYIKMFIEEGFQVRWAYDARQATNILLREEIDIILLDINMPFIDGRTMFEVIREYNPKLKIIISSVYPVDKQKQMIPWATDYYDKAQGPLLLLEKVRHILGPQKSDLSPSPLT